jgi:hypothetical protein
MEIETFEKAKELLAQINVLKTKKSNIEKMKKREDDNDFNVVKEDAYYYISRWINHLENKFKDL